MSRMRWIAIVVLVGLAGCGPSDPLRADTMQLGRSLNPDNSIASHTSVFKPGDTMYVAALTGAPGHGSFRVRWIYMGRVVSEASKEVSYRGPAATEFHLQNVAGFPPGDYSVELFLNGESVGKREYRVDK